MRIAVVGVGAVGGYFGGRLVEAGADVTFIARGETLRSLRTDGLRVESPNGDIVLSRVNATDRLPDVGPVDVVLLAVKAWQVPNVAREICPLVGEETIIAPLQNGVEAVDQLAAVHGNRHVLGGMCRIVAAGVAPAHVKHIGVEPFIALGELDNRRTDRVASLVDTLGNAGIACKNPADIHASIWSKFLFIAPVSGVGAVARVPLGVVRTVPETRALVERAMEEVRAVAAAKGIGLSEGIVQKTLAFLDGIPAEATSSMQRDIMEGRPSELEAISGAVVRLGHAVNVDTPVNNFVYASLLPSELEARAKAAAGE